MELVRRKRSTAINIVPLIDVLVVLVFFFLMTMQFRNVRQLSIELPEAVSAGQGDESRRVRVVVTQEGDFFWDDEAVSREELEARLRALSEETQPRSVLVSADRETPLRHVTWLMDTARQLKIPRLNLETDPAGGG